MKQHHFVPTQQTFQIILDSYLKPQPDVYLNLLQEVADSLMKKSPGHSSFRAHSNDNKSLSLYNDTRFGYLPYTSFLRNGSQYFIDLILTSKNNDTSSIQHQKKLKYLNFLFLSYECQKKMGMELRSKQVEELMRSVFRLLDYTPQTSSISSAKEPETTTLEYLEKTVTIVRDHCAARRSTNHQLVLNLYQEIINIQTIDKNKTDKMLYSLFENMPSFILCGVLDYNHLPTLFPIFLERQNYTFVIENFNSFVFGVYLLKENQKLNDMQPLGIWDLYLQAFCGLKRLNALNNSSDSNQNTKLILSVYELFRSLSFLDLYADTDFCNHLLELVDKLNDEEVNFFN